MTDFNVNQRLGRYKLVSLLGTGFSGEVWLGVSAVSNSAVALKVFRKDSVSELHVKHEYAMATKVDHPNLLKPISVEKVDGYWIMELPLCLGRSVDGVSGFMAEKHVWKLLYDVSSGLSALHANGLGHFDIKPSNILWNENRFIISDFGSCKNWGAYQDECMITSDESSYRFDAPELIRGRYVSASDIWSLGATAFNLLMGCHVFGGLGGRAQQEGSPIPYMRKNMTVLSELITRCLTYDYNQRPTANEIKEISKSQMEIHASLIKERPKKNIDVDQDSAKKNKYFWEEDMVE